MLTNENWDNVRILGRTPVIENGLELIWSGSGVEFVFKGTELGMNITGGSSVYQPWLSLLVDGAWIMHMPVQEGINKVMMLKGLDPGVSHNIRIVKDTQAMPDDRESFVILNSLLILLLSSLIIISPVRFHFVFVQERRQAGRGKTYLYSYSQYP